MKVSDYLKEKNCIMELVSVDKDGAIREIADCLDADGKLLDKVKFVLDVIERESLGSTGIGNSVGIPHARTDAVKGFVIGFGRSTAGIEFQALDGEEVNLVFLMGADPGELNLYLRLLAELSKLLMNNAFRQALLSSKTPKEVVQAINNFERR
jgi:fructose PTS system EIIBC or EIIC component